jgi:hypothetical protein
MLAHRFFYMCHVLRTRFAECGIMNSVLKHSSTVTSSNLLLVVLLLCDVLVLLYCITENYRSLGELQVTGTSTVLVVVVYERSYQ